jgi:hypothetical protein
MSVGIITNKGTLDLQAGTLAQQIGIWARSATNLNQYLLAATEADLEALGYSTADVALLKSASGDMAKLAQIFEGAAEQTPAYDFRTFTARIAGLQL